MSLILFFTNVGPNLANDITEPDENISIYDYLGVSIEQSLFMRPVDEEEVIMGRSGRIAHLTFRRTKKILNTNESVRN